MSSPTWEELPSFTWNLSDSKVRYVKAFSLVIEELVIGTG